MTLRKSQLLLCLAVGCTLPCARMVSHQRGLLLSLCGLGVIKRVPGG